ncbi:MAG: MoaD/ThiS family protein [Candidatus Hodarchaeales archaeon]|jgi:molybdopterin converting factor small subunit
MVIILINGRNINIFEGIETKLVNCDAIAIFPPTTGG